MFHGTVKPSKRVHTIHWHGMEPDPRNDGVGHTSFEVTRHYTYQWRPDVGRARRPQPRRRGNLLLPLPRQHAAARADGHVRPAHRRPGRASGLPGAGRGAARHSSTGRCTTSPPRPACALLASTRAGTNCNHAAGLSGEDVGLNRFEPKHFYLLGGAWPGPAEGRRHSLGCLADAGQRGRTAKTPRWCACSNVDYFPTRTTFTDARAGR